MRHRDHKLEGHVVYNTTETKLLLKFFTNIDSDVYAARDAMPTSLWAFLEGGYSRSELSMRDRFLAVFKEMTTSDEEYLTLLDDLIGDEYQSEVYSKVMDKAEQFMRKWAVDYGHSSLKDSAVDRLAIENVSIRATKILENSSLGAFQEKSTRYMNFSVDNFYIPESEFVGDVERQLLTDAMVLYREVLESATEFFKTQISRDDFKTEAAWIRTCKAKAFDEARYLLPTSTKTSLGVTLPTRETERWLSELFASPEKEIRDLAELIKTECVKINPGLLKHVTANPYSVTKTLPTSLKLYNSSTKPNPKDISNLALILPSTGYIEGLMGMAYLASCGVYDPTTVEEEDVLNGMLEVLEARGKYDEFPKWTAFGDNIFRFVIDIGAYRDVQRHRVGTQIPSDWCPSYGYSIPRFLEEEVASDLKAKYIALCERIENVTGELYKKDRFVAAYFLILGTNINVVYNCNFRQLAYFIELRSGPSGHYSYRTLAQGMYELVKDNYPLISKYIRVDMSGYSDRRAAEEKIQEKIQKAKES